MTIAVLIFIGWFTLLICFWSLMAAASDADDQADQYEQDHRSIDR